MATPTEMLHILETHTVPFELTCVQESAFG